MSATSSSVSSLSSSSSATSTKLFFRQRLEKKTELRFGVGNAKTVRVWLLSGNAEVFGAELKKSELLSGGALSFQAAYEFRNCHVAIYTQSGCTLAMCGKLRYKYQSSETGMGVYQVFNLGLTNARRQAESAQIKAAVTRGDDSGSSLLSLIPPSSHEECKKQLIEQSAFCGPRVAVIGPASSGKSTVCKILCNYGVRSGFSPILVDLDTSFSLVTLPGCIGAVSVAQPLAPNLGLNHTICSDKRDADDESSSSVFGGVTDPLSTEMGGDGRRDGREDPSYACRTLCYFVGHCDPRKNALDLYRSCVEQLALRVKQRLLLDPNVTVTGESGLTSSGATSLSTKAAGLIIKLPSWLVEVEHNQLLRDIVDLFVVDHCFVIQHDLTKAFLSSHPRGLVVEKLPKSGGVMDRTLADREDVRRRIINHYFYGFYGDYTPMQHLYQGSEASSLRIFSVSSSVTSSMLLPMGEVSAIGNLSVIPARMDSSLTRHVLAILNIEVAVAVSEPSEDESSQMALKSREPTASEIRSANVLGFAYVSEIDTHTGNVTVLKPSSFINVKSKALLKGSILWNER